MEKITVNDIGSSLKIGVATLALFMTLGSSCGTYAVMNYRVADLEANEATWVQDHEAIIAFKIQLVAIKKTTDDSNVKIDKIFDIVNDMRITHGHE